MLWIYASPIVARMTNMKIVWKVSIVNLIGYAMGGKNLVVYSESSVSIAAKVSCPLMASTINHSYILVEPVDLLLCVSHANILSYYEYDFDTCIVIS